jgi:hypothetical protein
LPEADRADEPAHATAGWLVVSSRWWT